ncbi:hypothetical protein V8F06_013288 [Rhypophila decipiens]
MDSDSWLPETRWLPDYQGIHHDMLVWLISTANPIIEADRLPLFSFTGYPPTKPAAGELKGMCRAIAGSKEPVPQENMKKGVMLLGHDILLRWEVNNYYRSITKPEHPPWIHEKNRSHRAYIDVLRQCYGILNGRGLEKRSSMQHQDRDDVPEVVCIPANEFELWPLEEGEHEEPESESEEPEEPEAPEEPEEPEEPEQSEEPAPAAKGKSSKRKTGGLSSKNGGSSSAKILGQDADDKSAKDAFDTFVTNFSRIWSTARVLLQQEWLKFSCNEANSVAVAAFSGTAVKLVEDSWTDLLQGFTGKEANSFESLLGVITSAQKPINEDQLFNKNLDAFHQAFLGIPQPDSPSVVNEYWMIHCYRDLTTFIDDFHKRLLRTGVPSPSMMTRLKKWKPDIDLAAAGPDKRILWRRNFTILLLYEMMHPFAIPFSKWHKSGRKGSFEEAIRSELKKSNQPIFGFTTFVNFIARLAFLGKQQTYRQDIGLNHVFQLQCIVDSMTASSGWLPSANPELPAVEIPSGAAGTCNRDIDSFLASFSPAVETVNNMFSLHVRCQTVEGDSNDTDPPPEGKGPTNTSPYRTHRMWAEKQLTWADSLSEVWPCPTDVPFAGFGQRFPDGLWRYSPYLSGDSLLRIIHQSRISWLFLWETLAEPVFVLVIIGLLLKRGYLHYGPSPTDCPYNLLIGSLGDTNLIGQPGREFIQSTAKIYRTGKQIESQKLDGKLGRMVDQALPAEYNSFFEPLRFKSIVSRLYRVEWSLKRLGTTHYPEFLGLIRPSKKPEAADSDSTTAVNPVIAATTKLLLEVKGVVFADVSGPGPRGAGGACTFGLNLPAITLHFLRNVQVLERAAWHGSKEAMSRIYVGGGDDLSNSRSLKRADLLDGLLSSTALQGQAEAPQDSSSSPRDETISNQCNQEGGAILDTSSSSQDPTITDQEVDAILSAMAKVFGGEVTPGPESPALNPGETAGKEAAEAPGVEGNDLPSKKPSLGKHKWQDFTYWCPREGQNKATLSDRKQQRKAQSNHAEILKHIALLESLASAS